MKKIIHGSIVGFDGYTHFRKIDGGGKSMSLLGRARQDECGQPCILEYDQEIQYVPPEQMEMEFGKGV